MSYDFTKKFAKGIFFVAETLLIMGITAYAMRDLESRPEIISQNVLGNDTPERFYVINNEKVYREIDGISVEDYFNQQIRKYKN